MTKKKVRPKTANRLLLTDRSLHEIAAIEQDSIEQWGKKTAAKYVAQLEDALSRIKSNPHLLRQEEGFHQFLQFYTANKHVLVFEIQDNDIILLTVFHGSMDIPARLAELEPTLATEVKLLHQQLQRK